MSARTIAVLIEAKHTNNSSLKHTIAQVTGYFAAFNDTDTMRTPLVFVLTETYIKLILYPFKKGRAALINAAVLELPLFNKEGYPDVRTLQMLVLLAK